MFDIEKLKTIPKSPGVYIWKDKFKKPIYIGKAKNLHSRMNQYFSKNNKNSFMTNSLMSEIADYEYVITKDEKDALILESNLIKKIKPYYNILLIDDKGHRFIRIKLETKNIDIRMTRTFKKDNALYFGPFPLKHNTKHIIDLLNSVTKFQDGLPVYNDDPKYWKDKYDLCLKILNPNNNKFKKDIEKQMYLEADQEHFELAETYKSILKSLEFYLPKTIVELSTNVNQDVWGIYEQDFHYSIYIMFYRHGKLLSTYQTIIQNNMLDTMKNYIQQFYQSNILPDEIYIQSLYLKDNDIDIKVINPKQSNGAKAVNMATTNAKDNIVHKLQSFKNTFNIHHGAIQELGVLLGIPTPKYIIMIDNSMTSNNDPVSGLVVYRNGIKQKHEYRKYNLIARERKADVDYMQQVFLRYWNKNKNNLPDLLILDGGKPQVSEINKLINKNSINLNIIGLVKDDNHSTRAIIDHNYQEIEIPTSTLMKFLASMQIEVDRFAKQHHNTRRRISSLEGQLIHISGIGMKTEQKLMNYFKTYSGIYNASIEELTKITSHKIAVKIKQHFST